MNNIRITFKALTKSIDFKVESENNIHDFVNDLFLTFEHTVDHENKLIKLQCIQRNSEEIRSRIGVIVEKYKHLNPKVYQIRDYFKELAIEEHFLFFYNLELNSEENTEAFMLLHSLEDQVDLDTIKSQINDVFGDFFKRYELLSFDGEKKFRIGESDKSKRVCRFCGKGNGEVTFKNVAHSISEAFGNKNIITNDECDSCNERFGAGIEHDLIQYLSLYRNFFQVRGKNGVPKLRGKNFEIEPGDPFYIHHYLSKEQEEDPERNPFNVRFESHESVALQNVYKAMVKYALSVMPTSELIHFRDTIEWINGETNVAQLPKVAMLHSYSLLVEHPKITLSIRKSEDQRVPYTVAEFRFTSLAFVFIIPLSSKDCRSYNNAEDFDHFWNSFSHYSQQDGWKFENMSDSVRRPFAMNLKFEVRKGAEVVE